MHYNEIIKRLRFMISVDDDVITECFKLGSCELPLTQVQAFMVAINEEGEYEVECTEEQFTAFLEGFIVHHRGPSPERKPVPLDNNLILKKLRIALQLEARDLDNAFMLSDLEVSAHEISALFRKPGSKHYNECSDEMFERFMSGLSLYMRS